MEYTGSLCTHKWEREREKEASTWEDRDESEIKQVGNMPVYREAFCRCVLFKSLIWGGKTCEIYTEYFLLTFRLHICMNTVLSICVILLCPLHTCLYLVSTLCYRRKFITRCMSASFLRLIAGGYFFCQWKRRKNTFLEFHVYKMCCLSDSLFNYQTHVEH